MTGNSASVSVLALAGCLVCPDMLSAQDLLRAHPIHFSSNTVSTALHPEPTVPQSEKKLLPSHRKISVSAKLELQDVGSSSLTEKTFNFDIPVQELTSALDQYAILVGRSVVVRDALAKGRSSSTVQGRYTPEAALRILLLNTGLMAESIGPHSSDAFVLKPATAMATGIGQGELDRSYDGLLQARVWEALCGDILTSPGRYRSILRFYVDQSGRLRKARLIVGSGNAQRDAAMLVALVKVHIEIPPPPNLNQPLTLILLPSDVIAGRTCDSVH